MSVSCSLLVRPRTSLFSCQVFSLSLLALFAALVLPDPAFSAQAVLTWDPPTTNADGTPLTDLAGYEVYYGPAPRTGSSYVYPNVQPVGNGTTTATVPLSDPTTAPVTYYFAVKAVDASGNKSDYSNEVYKTLQLPAQNTLTVTRSGTGSGTVTGTGINCGADCSEPFNQGVAVTLSATAATGSTFSGWSGAPCSGAGQCVVTMNSNISVAATFNTAVTNGACGSSNGGTFTSAPATNLCTAGTPSTVTGTGPWAWTCMGANGGTTASCSANIQTWTVTPSAGLNGSISPSTPQTVNQGGTKQFTVTPASGYKISSVTGCGGTLSGTTYTTAPVTANCTVSASFAVNTFTVTASAGAGGSITPSGAVTVNPGATQAFTITPAADYRVADVKVDGSSVGAVSNYTFSNVTGNHTISATFISTVTRYTITASASAGGTITPSGTVMVNENANQTFTITPSSGYALADVVVDGRSVGPVAGYYTFSNVTANHSISATFAAAPNVSASPASYNFGAVRVKWSKNNTFSVYNRGTGTLLISRAEIAGTDQPMFSITRTYGSKTVAPSGTYNIRVKFSPTTTGAKNAILRITSNDPDTPVLDIPIAGSGY